MKGIKLNSCWDVSSLTGITKVFDCSSVIGSADGTCLASADSTAIFSGASRLMLTWSFAVCSLLSGYTIVMVKSTWLLYRLMSSLHTDSTFRSWSIETVALKFADVSVDETQWEISKLGTFSPQSGIGVTSGIRICIASLPIWYCKASERYASDQLRTLHFLNSALIGRSHWFEASSITNLAS